MRRELLRAVLTALLCAIVIAACGGGGAPPSGAAGAGGVVATTTTTSAGSLSPSSSSPTGGAGGTGGTTVTGAGGAAPDAGNDASDDAAPDAADASTNTGTDAGADPCLPNGQPAPVGTSCEDGNPCNGAETCDDTGHCTSGAPPNLDDGDACTLDACDPAQGITHAPCTPIDPTVTTTIASTAAFLTRGPNPPQKGIAQGTIEPARAAIVRGRVANAGGSPFVGAAVSVVGHPEYGMTATFADGWFYVHVNGGGPLTVDIAAPGFIRAQRTVDVPWNDYARAADVVLLPYDSAVATIDLQSPDPIQIAQGSISADADGVRRATLMFAAGTSATLTLPGGAIQPLTGPVHVRATELTVGNSGPAAMPATLPQTSAYTYAVELSVDEAVAAGATRVEFDKPVAAYVDNFLGFRAGTSVPAGYYDPVQGVWVASANGRVLDIVGETGGLADLDADGDGAADGAAALGALGISDAERAELSILYAPGDSIWRVPVQHFSAWDYNFGFGPPGDACAPFDRRCASGGSGSSSSSSTSSSSGDPRSNAPEPDPCERPGSVIECQNQTLGESVAVPGTPYRLHYRSDRARGRKDGYALTIPLSGDELPASLARIDLTIEVAGRTFESSVACPCSLDLSTTFAWDGLDAFGRALQGAQPVTVTLGYVYAGVYALTPRFGRYGNGTLIAGNPTRREVTLAKIWKGSIGVMQDDLARGIGGWALGVHSVYDPVAKVVYRGDGTRRQADAQGLAIPTAAGGNGKGFAGDSGPAKAAKLNWPRGLAAAPDGALFIADTLNRRVRRVDPDGTIATVAGDGSAGYSGDGGPATTAGLSGGPNDVALGPDGSLYIAELGASVIRKVASNGIIRTVAGDGTSGFSGDGGPATAAQLDYPWSIAVAQDGTLYIADYQNARVRAVGTDGIISTVAGGGAQAPAEGLPATQASIGAALSIALARDGALLFAAGDGAGPRQVWRAGTEGLLSLVAGTGASGDTGDGGPARDATFRGIWAIATGADGTLYVADGSPAYRVRRVAPDGTIAAFAGVSGGGALAHDGGPAAGALLGTTAGMAVGPDGTVFLSDGSQRVFGVGPVLPGLRPSVQSVVVASPDGDTALLFDARGRHVETFDTRTDASLYTFGYDAGGMLASVTDVAGNATAIVRDADGNATAIVAPHGQTTALAIGADGYLASVTDPAGGVVQMGYGTGGLLTSLTDAKGQSHTFTYDAEGRLVKDEDPAGGYKTLSRAVSGSTSTVTLTTALGKVSSYVTAAPALGGQDRTIALPNGLSSVQHRGLDDAVTIQSPDGVQHTVARAPDPRFGMQAPYASSEIDKAPSGLARTVARSRAAGIATLLETTAINGHPWTSLFDLTARTLTETSPLGRATTTTFDASGRMVGRSVPGLFPAAFAYDAEGRLASATRGARMWTRAYDPLSGELASVTDPMVQVTSFARDANGRVTSTVRADGQSIAMSYDGNSNTTGVTPPGQAAHALGYTPVDQLASYAPPAASMPTAWAYDLDGQLASIARPDGLVVGYARDAAGRLSGVVLPAGQGSIGYAYNPTTGQLASVTGPMGIALAYGRDGALLTDRTWSGAAAGDVHRTYDTDFRVRTESVSGGSAVSFSYDADGLLTQAGTLLLTHDPQNGLLSGSSIGSVTDTVSHDGYGGVSGVAASAGAQVLYAATYTHDLLGRIVQRVETIAGVTRTYDVAYDLAGRLTDMLEDGALAVHYDYDANGNRTGATTVGGTVAGTYDAEDRLVTFGTKSYSFAAAGEQQSVHDSANGQTATYAYDALGGLRQAVLGDGTAIDYVLDGENHRIWKKKNGVTVQGFLWGDALRVAAELDAGGAVVARFVYATRANVPDVMMKGGIVYRFVTDLAGSPRLVVDTSTGTVVQQMDYDGLGRVVSDTNPGFQPFGFAGGLYDGDTGLVRFGARDYDAETGRWTAKDPLLFDAGDSNLYAYCGGDPVNCQDPDGRNPLVLANPLAWGYVAIGFAGYLYLSHPDVQRRIKDAIRDVCKSEPKFPLDPDCAKVKNSCLEQCGDSSLPTPDYGYKFWNCVNACMRQHGC